MRVWPAWQRLNKWVEEIDRMSHLAKDPFHAIHTGDPNRAAELRVQDLKDLLYYAVEKR